MPTLHKPTSQQAAILDSGGQVTRIDARAGTGKTTTLHLLAHQYPDKKILYLVFNRRARLEAKEKFPAHVDVHTIHSLAKSTRASNHKWQLSEKQGGIEIHDLLSQFAYLGSKQQVVAALAQSFLKYFLNSDFSNQDDAIRPFCSQFLTEKQRDEFSKHANAILDVCKAKTAAWFDGNAACPHDFYLKLAHVQGLIDKRLRRYNMILVDEGQDLTEVTLDSLRNFAGRVFLVGDSHQQLYRFRYAINAMGRLKPDAEYELSLSFRSGHEITQIVSQFIQQTKGLKNFKIDGNPDINSKVYLHSGIPHIKFERGSAVLSRTNLSLFESAVELAERGMQCKFIRGIRPILYQALDTYNLSYGEHEKIRDPLINSFGDIDELKEYAEEMEDYAKLALIKIVQNYRGEMPGIIFDILETDEASQDLSAEESVTLATVHVAKGAEFDRVYLHEDLVSSLSRELKDAENNADDEINIMYVGMTRAARELHLPVELRDEVKLDWRSVTSGQSEEMYRFSGTRRDAKPQKPKPHAYAIGDRVSTRSGTGNVIDVLQDGMLLVQLHDQPFKVRERQLEVKFMGRPK